MAILIQGDGKSGGGDFPVKEKAKEGGTYLAELIEVKQYDGWVWENQQKTDRKEPKLIFIFKALKGLSASDFETSDGQVSPFDSNGEPIEFTKGNVRAIAYGNEKSAITIIVDQLAGRGDKKPPAITADERKNGFDIEGFVGNKYKLNIEYREDGEKVYNNIISISKYKNTEIDTSRVFLKTKPASIKPVSTDAALNDDEDDPFANDNDEANKS